MRIVFTDLDGTDHTTYSSQPAVSALDRLRQSGVPVVFVTSKTFKKERMIFELFAGS